MGDTQLTDRDLQLLAFIAEHRLVLAAHVEEFLGVAANTAYSRLRALTRAGLLSHHQLFHRQPGCYQITRRGLGAVDSRHSVPRIDLRCYRHDVGVAWLWLAAHRGALGPVGQLVSERQLRSHDAAPDRDHRPLGVRLFSYGPGGRERLHYPDLLVLTPEGRRIAVELELSGKGRARRERIVSGYGADARIDAVVYLVDRPEIGRDIAAAARRIGIGHRVHVQRVVWGREHASLGAPAADRAAGRGSSRAHRGRSGQISPATARPTTEVAR